MNAVPQGDRGSAPKRRAAFVFIFITLLLDMMALGLVMPILPKLVASFVGDSASASAEVFCAFATAWAVMQFFSGPLLGMLSDRFGRRPVVLFSDFGLGHDYFLMGFEQSV